MRLINRRITNLKEEIEEFNEYTIKQNERYRNGTNVDDNLLNVNIQLNYKNDKIIELQETTKKNLTKINDLSEKLIENRGMLVKIKEANEGLGTGVNRATNEVSFILRREFIKKCILVGLIIALGLLDIVAIIYRVVHLFN